MKITDLFNLNEKIAIVTGASGGLGKQISAALAESGANLVLTARKMERLEKLKKELEDYEIEVLTASCNVGVKEEVNKLVDETLERFGRIDILVNNAGTTWGQAAEDYSFEGWEKVMSTNITGAFLCSQAVGLQMIKQKYGKIINISSVLGFRGLSPDIIDSIAYNASKGALNALTMDLAVKWAKYNINVNAIAPGWFPSELTDWLIENRGKLLLQKIPMNRFGGEHDIKGALLYLASDASQYVTGHILCVDGGYLAM